SRVAGRSASCQRRRNRRTMRLVGERLGYRPALDGVRALAITGVVLAHAYRWPPGGGFGVDLFFVLSGFLITTLLLEEHAAHGRISLVDFYRRRAFRLLPALYTLLLVYLAIVVVRGEFTEWFRPLSALAAFFYATNLVEATGWGIDGPVRHLWSLAAEEQFYFVWPLL